jgi:hypothetical protein
VADVRRGQLLGADVVSKLFRGHDWRCCAAGLARQHRGCIRYRFALDHYDRSSFIGFFAGAYAAVKLGDLAPRLRPRPAAENFGGENTRPAGATAKSRRSCNLHGSSDMSLCHSDSDQALVVLVRTFPNAPVASANLATLSPLADSTISNIGTECHPDGLTAAGEYGDVRIRRKETCGP